MDLGGLGRAGTSDRGKAFTLIVAARAISIRRRALTSLSLRPNLLFFAFPSRRASAASFHSSDNLESIESRDVPFPALCVSAYANLAKQI